MCRPVQEGFLCNVFPVPGLNPESNTKAVASRPKYLEFRPAATPLSLNDNFINLEVHRNLLRSGLPMPLICWKIERSLAPVGKGIMSEIHIRMSVIERQP